MKDLLNIPNVISASRMVLAIPAAWCLMQDTALGYVLAMVLLNFLELTDATDGYIARDRGQVTEVGKLLDPLFDSLCRFTIFATLLAVGLMPLWMLLIFFYRDVSISYYRSFSAQRNVTMSARVSGKVKAVVQGVGVILVTIVLLSQKLQTDPQPFSDAVFYGILGGAVVATVLYLALFRVWGAVVATISAVGGGSGLLLILVWATKWEIPHSDHVIFGLLATVAAVTAWSLADYTSGFLDVLRRTENT